MDIRCVQSFMIIIVELQYYSFSIAGVGVKTRCDKGHVPRTVKLIYYRLDDSPPPHLLKA